MSQTVLVVDDSPLIRRVVSDWIKAEDGLTLVGTASNGEEAVKLAQELRPDVITLDVEMPVKDGLTALREIMTLCPSRVLMVSSRTVQGADTTLAALEGGALDFVAKPNGSSSTAFLQTREELIAKIRGVQRAAIPKTRVRVAQKAVLPVSATDRTVLIASSTGGPAALATLWQSLPKGFPAPILMVQHMPAGFTASLAKRLDSMGTVPCREAKHGDTITPGVALLAPGGQHMVVESGGVLSLNTEPAIHGVRPAADFLFESAAEVLGAASLAVILTGMGKDGAAGALKLKHKGATVLGEDESSCTIYGMPRAAKEIGAVDLEVPLDQMGAAIVERLKRGMARAS